MGENKPPEPVKKEIIDNPEPPPTAPVEIHPVTMFGKDDWAGKDFRPQPVPSDTPELPDPKDSSVVVPADSSLSETKRETESPESQTPTTAPVEKDNGASKESSPGTQTSSSETPTSPGNNEQPVSTPTPKPSSPTSPTLPQPTKQSPPASTAK